MDEKLETKLVARRSIYRGRIVHLDVDRVIEPSGQEVEREVIRHGGAAVLLTVTNEGRVVLVRQYRYASGELMLEVPAGTIEPANRQMRPRGESWSKRRATTPIAWRS